MTQTKEFVWTGRSERFADALFVACQQRGLAPQISGTPVQGRHGLEAEYRVTASAPSELEWAKALSAAGYLINTTTAQPVQVREPKREAPC